MSTLFASWTAGLADTRVGSLAGSIGPGRGTNMGLYLGIKGAARVISSVTLAYDSATDTSFLQIDSVPGGATVLVTGTVRIIPVNGYSASTLSVRLDFTKDTGETRSDTFSAIVFPNAQPFDVEFFTGDGGPGDPAGNTIQQV